MIHINMIYNTVTINTMLQLIYHTQHDVQLFYNVTTMTNLNIFSRQMCFTKMAFCYTATMIYMLLYVQMTNK